MCILDSTLISLPVRYALLMDLRHRSHSPRFTGETDPLEPNPESAQVGRCRPTLRGRLPLICAVAVLVSGIAVSQVSQRDLAIDHIRRILSIYAGFSGTTYGDLDLERDIVDLQGIMTSREFDKAGLNKLSPDEMQSLNTWVSEFVFDLLRSDGCSIAIESKINGDFEGWSGETIVRLMNGQIWQQASYRYKYAYKYSPDVIVFSSSGGCKMLVEGMDDPVSVRQLR